jgi:hypothetical protein
MIYSILLCSGWLRPVGRDTGLTQPAFPSEAFHIKLSTVSVLLEVAVEGAGSSRHPAVGIES